MNDANPFTGNGSYDRSWTILIIHPRIGGILHQQRSVHGCYAVSMNPEYPYFQSLFSDFIQFETDHGRKIILVSDHPMNMDFQTHYLECTVRPSDPRFLVHSTTLAAYNQIVTDGLLKSSNRLKAEGMQIHPIGLAPLGEPDDYLDYIMFGSGVGPELVVNSRLCGKVNYNPNAPYIPQARLYFDGYKMVKDGRIIRNVASMAYNSVPLQDYLIKTIVAYTLQMPDKASFWTPLLFSNAADGYMQKHFG